MYKWPINPVIQSKRRLTATPKRDNTNRAPFLTWCVCVCAARLIFFFIFHPENGPVLGFYQLICIKVLRLFEILRIIIS
jgi:hypothetical protein